jgi:cyclopropane fatty-acyl-phospholipid synthase-like methyltransferase
MSMHAVTLDEKHFQIAEEKARALGTTPEQYLQSLIDADSRSFDQILQPVQAGFDNMTDPEIDDLFTRAQKAARQSCK